jgi:RNA polymerase sigma-70 factor (ECF subfamily)
MFSFPEPVMPEVLLGQEESAESAAVYADWSDLVARIRSGQTDGMEELYHLFSRGVRFYFAKQLGFAELDDRVVDTFGAVVQAIRRDELKDPERLLGFVRTMVRKQVAAHAAEAVPERATKSAASSRFRQDNPGEAADFHRRAEIIDQVLAALTQRDREILTRFYLGEQNQDEICRETGLTETQFRLLKSRAKARFAELGKLLAHRGRSRPLPKAIDSPRGPDAGEMRIGPLDVILPVVAHAVAVFGDEKKASHWLATPLPLLGDRSPSQLLKEQEGIELVDQVLTRIEHNIPS